MGSRRSLRARVRVSALTVIAVALLVASAAVWALQAATLERQLDDVLGERLQLALEAADHHVDHAALAGELGARGLRAVVIAPDGTEHTAEVPVPRVGRNLPVPGGTATPTLHERAVPLPIGGEVVVAVSRDGVDAARRRLVWLQLAAASLTLPAVALALHRTTDLALRPLDTVVDTANSIAEGDTSRRLRPEDAHTEIGQVATAFDRMLDELEAAIRRSHAAERATRRFLDAAAHQLRTPVAASSASVQALLRAPGPAEYDDLLLTASRETERAGRMVNDLLRAAQLDEGLALDLRATNVEEVVAAEVERAARRAPHLSIARVPTGDTPLALIDRDATAEIVANLLDNATRHAANEVVVRVTFDDHAVAIMVADDGPGVAADDADDIFERFVTRAPRGGTGLGLPIARELARAQGGDVIHTAEGFTIVLPRTSHAG